MDEPIGQIKIVAVKKEDHQKILEILQRTLDHFKAGRPPLQSEKEELWRMLQHGIEVFELAHAVSGMRFEPSTSSYDPSKHINVFRLWNPERRAKLMTLSTQEAERRRLKRLEREKTS